jgi:glutathione S-transferase
VRLLPAGGDLLENLDTLWRVARIRRGRLELTHPRLTVLDELPLVPYLLGPEGENLYDSSAIAEWLDAKHIQPGSKLIPEDPELRFATLLVDEYFDEFGLYMAHHNRWILSASDNDAGRRLAGEYRSLLPGPLRGAFARWFSRRQTRRLAYLFSVAAKGEKFPGARAGRPPSPTGFPATHELLAESFERMLSRLEAMLSRRPYLFGERFTLADASAYGQLCMNAHDPAAERLIARNAPATRQWVARIEAGDLMPAHACGTSGLMLSEELDGLIDEICATFVPLMRQNEAAYVKHAARGRTVFNEAAFDRARGLYYGSIGGRPYRAVAKTFQVKVWRRLLAEWEALEPAAREGFPAFAAAVGTDAPTTDLDQMAG